MAIADWPAAERPREKLLNAGAQVLSDAELLAIFLRTGRRGRSAVDLARELLSEFGSLNALCAADRRKLCAVPGLGAAKFAQLQAGLELARRALSSELAERSVLGSPREVRDYLRISLQNLSHEAFLGIFLDTRNRVIATEELARGSLTSASVYPREVVKRALHHNAASMIFAHNHPTGDTEPSAADRALTATLQDALKLIEVSVLDHFIVAGDGILGFKERGLL